MPIPSHPRSDAFLILLLLGHLPDGVPSAVVARLLDLGPERFEEAWALLDAQGRVRRIGELCRAVPQGQGLVPEDVDPGAAGLRPAGPAGTEELGAPDGPDGPGEPGGTGRLAGLDREDGEPLERGGMAEALFLLRRGSAPLEAVRLLMGQTKRHAPRSAGAASACLDIIVATLRGFSLESASDDMRRCFIHTIIELADITAYFPIKSDAVCPFLEQAAAAAEQFGDRRSVAILHLIHAHLLTFASFHITPEAERLFHAGFQLGEAIGDADMLEYIATFLGFRHFLRGEFLEAERQFSKVREGFALPNSQYWWVVFHAMSSAFLGLDRQAVGSLESALHGATLWDDQLSAVFLRLHLALILLMFGQTQDALGHIESVSEQIDGDSIPVLQIRLLWTLMYYHSRVGNMEAARVMTQKISNVIATLPPSRRTHHFPWILEILYFFKIHGQPEPKFFNLERELAGSLNMQSHQVQAGAWRIKGLMAAAEKSSHALTYFKTALKIAARVRNPIETARIKLDLARAYADLGRRRSVANLRRAAYAVHQYFGQPAWPEDVPRPELPRRAGSRQPWLRLHEAMSATSPPSTTDELQRRCLSRLCRRLRVEQAAIFGIQDGEPRALALYNMSGLYVNSPAFSSCKTWIQRQARTDTPGRRGGSCGHSLLVPLPGSDPTQYLYLFNRYFRTELRSLDGLVLQSTIQAVFDATYFAARAELSRKEARAKEAQTKEAQADAQDLFISAHRDQGKFITSNETMHGMLFKLKQAAATGASIHLFGETGVGKELLARFIHQHSGRKGPFVCVHPASMTESLFESAFFGHEKGSFTGAVGRKIGFFELAHDGTLFIDEIGEMDLSIQAKFLRVLQEHTFIRVGGLREITSDFRLVTATNRDLEKEVAAGNFRMDLYYRISVIPVQVPPLRRRGNDALILAQTFLNRFVRKYQRGPIALGEAERRRIAAYPWPGNVRELENVIERAVILYNGGSLDLSVHGREPAPAQANGAQADGAQADRARTDEARTPSQPGVLTNGPNGLNGPNEPNGQSGLLADWPTLEEMERRYIKLVLDRTGGKIDGPDGAVSLLGIGRSTLYAKMRKFGFKLLRKFE